MSQEHPNFYDDLQPFDVEGAKKYQEAQKIIGRRIAYLNHKIFAQTEEGRELLAIWSESVLMVPVAAPEADNNELLVREGYNRFVRAIISTTRQVEAGEK